MINNQQQKSKFPWKRVVIEVIKIALALLTGTQLPLN